MVSSAPTAAQSQATAAWLSELRRWLHLGRDGVIIVVRDAQQARLRELVMTLDELESEYAFTDDPAQLLALARGSLVLLVLRPEHLDQLNLNRPVFAERALRVVVWAAGDLATQLKFLAPDLHDWVSHFVPCPVGVPEFALRGLERGLRWWPGVAWTGPYLELALEQVLGVGEWLELDPASDYSSLVTALQAEPLRCVIWRGIETVTSLWRVRWAIAEARHGGPHVLDNPGIGAPGWAPVRSDQLDMAEASALAGSLRDAALAECEPGAFAPLVPDAATIERVGLLQGTGPELRALHESAEVAAWRSELLRRMWRTPNPEDRPWSRHEQAIFSTLARRRKSWPKHSRMSWVGFVCEHGLWMGATDKQKSNMLWWVSGMGQQDIVARWTARWEVAFEPVAQTTTRFEWGENSSAPQILLRGPIDADSLEEGIHVMFRSGTNRGWDVPSVGRFAAVQLVLMGEHGSGELTNTLDQVIRSAADQLGPKDPQFLLIARIAGLAAGVYANPDLARSYLEDPGAVAASGRYPSLTGADLELSVVLAMLGRFDAALLVSERARATDPDDEAIVRLHQLTRAGLGQPAIGDAARWDPDAGEGLLGALDREGRQLLRSRLLRLANLVEDAAG